MNFQPYAINPFEMDFTFRIKNRQNGNICLYENLVQNLIAWIYYELHISKTHQLFVTQGDQHQLFEAYSTGELMVDFEDEYFPCFPLTRFANYELCALEKLNLPEVKVYKDFIVQHMKWFEVIECCLDYNFDQESIDDFKHYLKDNDQSDLCRYVLKLYSALKRFKQTFVKQVGLTLLNDFDLSKFPKTHLEDLWYEIQIQLKNDLLTTEKQDELRKLTYKWFSYMLRDVCSDLKLRDLENLVEDLKQDFCEATSYSPTSTETQTKKDNQKDYPFHVFASYKAYQFFHDVAGQIKSNATISFIYRKMENEKLIHLKDSDFRKWFEQQSYPVEFYSATSTLNKVFTQEREVFVSLLLKTYAVVPED